MLTQVADGVFVHQSALLKNNAVAVQGADGVLLIDPGITEAEMTCLATDLQSLGQPVVAGFATHPDWDHALWHSAFGDAPRYGTARSAELLRDLRSDPDWRSSISRMLPPEIIDETPVDLYGLIEPLPDPAPRSGELPWNGPRVRVIEHPAHSPGHAALLITDRGVLAAGDMLSDLFVPMLDDFTDDNDPIADYLTGLDALEAVADQVTVVVPGHGSVGRDDVRARIALDRAYLQALRDGRDPDDPRIGPDLDPDWAWVRDIHAGQAASVAARRS